MTEDEEMAKEYAIENYESCMYDDVIGWETDYKAREQAFLAGLNAGRQEWHYVSDGDLPEEDKDGNILVYHTSYGGHCKIGYFKVEDKCFKDIDIIAWKEIDLPRRNRP